MKGTPMLRNFGISPLREEDIVTQTKTTADAGLVNTANAGNTTVAAIEYEAPDQTIKKEKKKEKKEKAETDEDKNPSFDEEEQKRMNKENRKKARAHRRSQRKNN